MLHALLDYAQRENLAAEPGFKLKTIRWLLVFSPEGRFLGLQDLRGDDRKSRGRDFRVCPDLTQPELIAAGAGARHFLVDGLDVVTLLTKDGEIDDKLTAKHDYFANLLDQASSSLPELAAIAMALGDAATLDAMRAKLVEHKAKPTELATFAVPGDSGLAAVLVERDDWHPWWRSFRTQLAAARQKKGPKNGRKSKGDDAGTPKMRCLLSGELVDPQPTHNKISGLSDVGGQGAGDVLAGFDKEAFRSFGLSQAANAAMGEAMVKIYTTALNDLIKRRSRRLAGVKVVYWYSGRVEEDHDVLAEVLAGINVSQTEEPDQEPSAPNKTRERHQAESRAKRLLDAIRSGDDWAVKLADFRYYALTLSANSGRVVIRDWMEGSFEELVHVVNAWFEDLSIVSRDGRRTIQAHKFAAVLAAPLRDLKDAPAPLVAALWRCVLKGQPIPYQVMAQTLHRVRLDLVQDETPRHARFGLLKAFCNREERIPNMTTELNDLETHPAYLCGRIMAILARIQHAALGDVGAGVVQRYYAAASATPALVLGRLVRTAQIAHLPKIGSKGLQIWFENQLADTWAKLSQAPPVVLNPEGQTLFAMGYYHQRAKTSKSTGESEVEQTAATNE